MAQRVLIVEDDTDLRAEMQSLLEEHGYGVTAVGNGADALLILRHGEPPEVILLDLMLPLMSGWELSTELARDSKLARIPVIVLSGITDRREALLLRVDPANCLKKPFGADELLAAVRRCLP